MEEVMAKASNFCDSLQGQAAIFKNDLVGADEALTMCDVREEDKDFIAKTFLPLVWEKARKDEVIEIENKMQGKTLLKMVFYSLKELEDRTQLAKKRHKKNRDMYASHHKSLHERESRKRKGAEIEVRKILDKNPDDRENKLARRNQINRKRRGIKTIVKKRSEEKLPEACPTGCVFPGLATMSYVTMSIQ